MDIVLFEIASFRIRTSARMVVRSPNAVHSVLYRVVVFVNASRRRFLLQVEFRARILRVVYVGAIAVLFRFVVMMLNLSETVVGGNQEGNGESETTTRGLRGFVLGGMTVRLGRVRVSMYTLTSTPVRTPTRVASGASGGNPASITYVEWVNVRDTMWGINGFGQILYNDGILYVVGAGMVLLVAMIGSIVLTLKVRTFARAKRQQVDQQRSRDADQAIRRVKNK
jgi:NADH-quinone oxidoreductase subunit J